MKEFKVFKFNADGKYLVVVLSKYIDSTDDPLKATKIPGDSNYVNNVIRYLDGKLVTIEVSEADK